ncbi:hypothetical protein GCM10022254_54210 [Actinomadura meridiana]|uniref:Uncharacterized protein n=1 Tax=Actinomadura meridiana TaxID=559626 RepID=A0ABP8CES1_9ACTN
MEPDHVDEIVTSWRAELPEIAGLPLELAKRTALFDAAFDALTVQELHDSASPRPSTGSSPRCAGSAPRTG